MDGTVVHGAIRMARGSFALIEDGRGMRVELWDGALWITQEGDTRDHFLQPGESFLLEREGVVIVSALRASQVTLTAPVPAHYAERIVLAAPGDAPRALYERLRERGGWLAAAGHRLARLWTNWYAQDSRPTTAGL